MFIRIKSNSIPPLYDPPRPAGDIDSRQIVFKGADLRQPANNRDTVCLALLANSDLIDLQPFLEELADLFMMEYTGQ